MSKKHRHSTNIYKKADGRCPSTIIHYYPEAATDVVLGKKLFLKIPTKFTGKSVCQGLSFNEQGSGMGALLWILLHF